MSPSPRAAARFRPSTASGLEKQPWLELCRSPAELALMQTLKQALDPQGILNPGRVLPR